MGRKTAGVVVALAAGLAWIALGRPASQPPPAAQVAAVRPLPRLVDLGAGKCIPCKAMAPILEELRTEYAGRLEVQFIDVWQDPEAARPYGIRLIPTQIFYGADGRELARHQGFMSREDILAQWRALGVSL
jgi:thioredoxin 1